MGSGERGMRLTIFHKILHSEQFEGAEFIDDKIVFCGSWQIVLDEVLDNFDEFSNSAQIEGGEFSIDKEFL